jgi:hypothetical protein
VVQEHRRADKRYDFYLGLGPTDAYVLVRDIGPETGPVVARPMPGRTVEVRILRPEETKGSSVEIEGDGWFAEVAAETRDGELWFVAHGVPPGPCRVRAFVSLSDTESRSKEIEETTESRLTIDLRGE